MQTLEKWVETDAHSQRAHNEAREASLGEELAERNEEICQLEQKLELVSKTYKAKTEALTEGASGNNKAVREEVHNGVVELQQRLEQGFKRERERSEQNLRQSQTAIAALESQLKAVNNHLAITKLGPSQERNLDDMDSGEDQTLISQLQQKVHKLERQANATKDLRDRWQRDMKTVDALRGQLNSIQERMPQMERFDATLGQVAEVNRLVCSTAQYLVHEGGWVQQLHEQVIQNHGEAPHDEDRATLTAAEEPKEPKQCSDVVPTEAKCEGTASQRNTGEALTEFSAHGLCSKRKVEVHSPEPNGEAKFSFAPPSIEQEQMRRRDGAQPRSILKLSSSQESTTIEEQAARMVLGQNQYNRPVMGGISAAAASASMIEKIRSGQVPREPSNLVPNLPRVADFERCSQFALVDESQHATGGDKRRPDCPDEVPDVARKRSKLERNGIGSFTVCS